MALKKNSNRVKPRVRKVRRIVTGHDKAGRSIIVSDKASPFFASMGSFGAAAHGGGKGAARHPMMHRTKSIDYGIVLSGEIWAVMDKGETKMKAGDVLIQGGTHHAWSNRSRKPCLVAFVLMDAQPIPGLEDN